MRDYVPAPSVELNAIESFCFLFRYLWSPRDESKVSFCVLDTIIYREGKPFMWLFTSEKTGEILKKNSSRLLTPDEIIKGFKAKGKLVKGYKDNYYRPKIATIWYLLTNRTITSYLVDELELYSILTNNMFEVLAIQLFVGGYYCKGNGIFEHKMKSDKNNYRSYHTYEYIDKVTNNGTTLNNHYTHENGQTTIVNYNHNTQIVNNSPFTNYSKEKITIIDKQHETLKATTRRIVKHLEFSSGCRVKKIKLQYIFNSSWYPYIVSATNVILSNLPVNSTSGLNNFLYIDGIVPKLPAFSHKSFLLPQHWEDYQKKPNRFIEDDTPLNNNDVFTTDNISSGSPNKESTTVSKLDSSLKPESTVDSPKFPARKRTVNASSRKSSAMMENSEVTAEDIQRSMDELTSNLYTTNHVRFEDTDDVMSIDDDNIYGSHNNQRKKSSTEIIQEADYGPPISAVELAKLFSDTRTGRAESARATIAVGSRDYVLHQLHSENPSSENGELSSNLQKQKGRSSSSVGLVQRLMDNTATARRASTVSSRRPSNKENNLSTLAMGGESNTKFPPGFQQATLISDMRQNYYANQVKDQDVIAREEPRQPPRRPVSAPSNRISRGHYRKVHAQYNNDASSDDNDIDLDAQKSRVNGISASASVQLGPCFGDFCDFGKYSEDNVEKLSTRKNKPKHCKNRVAYKSILLARAEINFLGGVKLDHNIELLTDQVKLLSVQADQLYTFFVKRHMDSVSQKCWKLASTLSMYSMKPAAHGWDDKKTVYRKMIYADALSKVHLTRFYHGVTVCDLCSRIYTFMDAQRESVIFNKRSMDNGTTEVPESFPRPGRIDIRKPNNKLSKQRLLEKQVRYGINQLEDITDGMNENRSPSSSRPVSSIASLSGYRKNSMYNRSNSNSASNSPVRVSNSVNNHFDMNMDDLSTPSTTAEMKKKRAKRRIPRNSTNNNGADVVTDSGLGSKGPLHQDVSVGFTTKEGAISSWVKLLANKNQPTGERVRPRSANEYQKSTKSRTQKVNAHEINTIGEKKVSRPSSAGAVTKPHTYRLKNTYGDTKDGVRIGTASANEYEYLYNSADDNPSSANPSDTFAVRNLLQVNGIEFRTGEVKTTPKKKNNDVEANSSDKPHDSIASDFAFTSLPFSAAPYLPTHLSSHNYQNTPVSAISNSGMSVNNNVPQQFGLDTIKEQSLTIENSEVLENSKENFGRSPIKENNQQSQNTNSEHESPGSLWNSPFNNSSGMLVSPFGSPQKAWHQD